ncbi:MAG: beta-lactamase family protein [Gammaproteobacteria bacterium]|nr:beta-lactamase family protein [Gammaproteobacteria bacterium]
MLDGTVHPNYADVASSLIRQIPTDQNAGSAVCVYHHGQCVVDVWGGIKDSEGRPWVADTTAPSFSTTKGVMSTLIHILVDQGKARYDDTIASHWPEFGCRGKETITIRQALCHEAGLYRVAEMIRKPDEMLDWEHMKQLIADAEPAHEPGEAHGYHALTYGWLIGGIIEAISGKSLQAVLAEELVDPLQLDGMFIGMPHNELYRRAELTQGQVAPFEPKEGWQETMMEWLEAGLGQLGVELQEFNSALNPFTEPFDWNAEDTVQAVIPAANGQFTARSLARMYAMLAQGGELDGVRLLSEERVREITEVQSRTRDRVLFIPMHWRMGYHRAFTVGAKAPNAFGHYGYGGSGAFCDPSRELAVALTLNSGAGTPMGNSNMPRIARAAIKAVDRLR